MALKADMGAKFDKSKVDKILALSLELSQTELEKLVHELLRIQIQRSTPQDNKNVDTIST